MSIAKKCKRSTRLGRKDDPLGIMQEIGFDHTTEWYTQKPESIQENEPHEILQDFEIQMEFQILARRLDIVLITKKN